LKISKRVRTLAAVCFVLAAVAGAAALVSDRTARSDGEARIMAGQAAPDRDLDVGVLSRTARSEDSPPTQPPLAAISDGRVVAGSTRLALVLGDRSYFVARGKGGEELCLLGFTADSSSAICGEADAIGTASPTIVEQDKDGRWIASGIVPNEVTEVRVGKTVAQLENNVFVVAISESDETIDLITAQGTRTMPNPMKPPAARGDGKVDSASS
jgi:hypothetical protein